MGTKVVLQMKFKLLKISQILIGLILRRDISITSEMSFMRLSHVSFRFMLGLLRSILFLWRVGFLMSGANVRYSKKFYTNGKFIIETGSLIDCFSTGGVHVGKNFKLGRNSVISAPGSYLSCGHSIKIGDNVGLGEFCYIGGEAPVIIGSNTISGQYLSVHPENHIHVDEKLFRDSGTSKKGIFIGENVWIGSKVTILDGAVVGNNCILAAGAVVSGVFPDNCVIAGVPAKLVRTHNA